MRKVGIPASGVQRVNNSETVRNNAKMCDIYIYIYIDFDIFHHMVSLRKLFFLTLAYTVKVKYLKIQYLGNGASLENNCTTFIDLDICH